MSTFLEEVREKSYSNKYKIEERQIIEDIRTIQIKEKRRKEAEERVEEIKETIKARAEEGYWYVYINIPISFSIIEIKEQLTTIGFTVEEVRGFTDIFFCDKIGEVKYIPMTELRIYW